MTVDDLKKILDASPDGMAEVNISGLSHNPKPESIEYVMTFDTGEIWIVSNIMTMEEVRK